MMKSLNILIVDDDKGDIFMAQEALKDSGVASHLYTAGDGVEAMKFLESQSEQPQSISANLILLDINMPRMNGHEFLHWIRKHERFKTIPVVMFTTSDAAEDIQKSYNNHANCFVTKPVHLKQFNNVIKKIDHFWSHVVTLPEV